ncbi:helix-turn-helix domain-containing protein [Bradyrhizobium sp. PMVTL-01]|uniref:helix-turn-helix domain-containing protein n=1 Tax=Bradyrhizobium sp. PMVTL-01 TaxID=3434999 RepID=UPI003F70EA3C
MARWLLEIHDRVANGEIRLTQEALAQLIGVRRTTVTLTMRKLREIGCIISERRGVLEVHRTRLDASAILPFLMRSRKGLNVSLSRGLSHSDAGDCLHRSHSCFSR